jgi:hypothetical protein
MSSKRDSNADELVAWICWYASEQDAGLTSIQLVKYLYLADVFHARRFGGDTLTGWPWAFVHFGPFCAEALQTLERVSSAGLVYAQRYPSKYSEDEEFTVFRGAGAEPSNIDSLLSLGEMSDLKRSIRNWINDTAGLLDYVYFETEPMAGIQPRDILDFNRVRAPSAKIESKKPEPASFPERKRRKAKDAIARLKSRTIDSPNRGTAGEGMRDKEYHFALTSDVDHGIDDAISGEFDITKLISAAADES